MLRDFALETYFSRWEFAARYHLTASDAQTMRLAELLELADDEATRACGTSWPSATPRPTGCRRCARRSPAPTSTSAPAHVLCFAGAEEGLYLAMQVLLGPDDHAVVLTPNYQAAETVPLARCAVTGVALREADGWALDVDAIEAALRPNTRVVSVNFPNNPTGAVPDHAELAAAGRAVRTSAASGCSATRSTAGSSWTRPRGSTRPPTCRRARCRST